MIALASGSAWAADNNWTGAVDSNWNESGNWSRNVVPNANDADWVIFANTENLLVEFDSYYYNAGAVKIRNIGNATTPLVFKASDSSCGLQFSAGAHNFVAGDSGDAYFRFENGTWSTNGKNFEIGSGSFKGDVAVTGGAVFTIGNYLHLKNGTLILENGIADVTQEVRMGANAASKLEIKEGGAFIGKINNTQANGGTVFFNGGAIKAKSTGTLIAAHNKLYVRVDNGGGTIDSDGKAVTIAEPIEQNNSSIGGMMFIGGGTVTLQSANTYIGETKIAVRTKLVVTSAELARLLANGGIRVVKPEGVSAKGTFKLLGKGDEDCTAAEYALIRKGAGLEGARFDIDEDGDITVTVSHTPQTWAGAAETSATWGGNNWDAGVAFDDGNDAVFATDGAIAEVDADYSAYTLSFNDNAALTGTGTLTVPTITVAEGKTASIAGPLAGAIEKTGAGTLTLGSSRADTTTTLTEGTLVANVPIGTLVFGTDNPVTFDYCGQTLSTIPASAVGGGDVTLKNGTFGATTANLTMNSGTLSVEGNSSSMRLNAGSFGKTDGTLARYTQTGGTLNAASHFRLYCGEMNLTNVTFSAGANFEVGNSAAAAQGTMTMSGCDTAVSGNLNVFNGELVITSGTVTVPDSTKVVNMGSNGNSALVTLNSGGTLTVPSISRYGSGTGMIFFDGGTLKANAANSNGLVRNHTGLSVHVGANGGTIDTAGYEVYVHQGISGVGGVAYKGGGKVTLSVQPTYTGVTTVEVGTTLVVPAALAGEALAFTIPGELADGIYTVISISGDSQFVDDVLSGKAEGFVLSGDKKKICYVQGMDTTKPIYVGTDGNLSVAGNWLDGAVPTGGTGEAQMFCASATTLTVGDTFAPAKLVIPDGSASVTIGSGTLCVGEVVNRQLLIVGSGATVVIGDQLTLAEGESLCDQNNGTLVVSNLLLKAESGDRFITENQTASAPGVFKFDAVTNSMTGNWFYMTDHSAVVPYVFYIGAGGLNFSNESGSGAYCLGLDNSGNSMTTIRPWYSDFMIANRGTGNRSLILQHIITFCTDDENGIGRTITINANTRGQRNPDITVSGTGRLQVNGTCDNSAEPTVTVTDTATLSFGANGSLGTGAITLAAGTTLALTATSREFIAIANTLKLPTEGMATIRINGERLKSGPHVIAPVASGIADNVVFDTASAALNGRKHSWDIDDSGNLVLNIQSNGTMIIVR